MGVGCKGLSRKCGPELHANGGSHLDSKKRRAWPGRPDLANDCVSACSAIQFRDSPLLPLCSFTGGWALFSATLCRRSPTLGMGAATTVGPRAGVLTRVGESRALAPCILAPKGGGWCPLWPLPCRLPFLGPFDMVAPSHSWDKGWGRIPTRDTPATHAPSPHLGGGAWLTCTSAGGMGGWDSGMLAEWTPPHLMRGS